MTPWFVSSPFFHLIQYAQKEYDLDARFEKDSRYYVIRLSQDLLEDWVITLINGRIKSKLGQSRTLAFANFNDGFEHFCALAKLRHQRRYQLKTITCNNPIMLHLLPFMVYKKDKKALSATQSIKSTHQFKQKDKKTASILNNISYQTIQLGFAF